MVLFIISAVTLLIFPQVTARGVINGLNICANSILPALFPYMVLSNLFIELGYGARLSCRMSKFMDKVFHLPPCCASGLVLGCISGFPIGARIILQEYENQRISRKEAEYTLSFCSNAGPAFIFGVVGRQLFHSAAIGAALWAIHIAAALITGFLLRPENTSDHSDLPHYPSQRPSVAFIQSVEKAGSSVLQICMYVVIFSVIVENLKAAVPNYLQNTMIFRILYGCLELAGGVRALHGIESTSAFVIASGLLAWNGLCIHCQVMASPCKSAVSYQSYFKGKLLQMLISILFSLLLLPLLPLETGCFADHQQPSFAFAALMFILAFAVSKTSTGKLQHNRI